MRQYPRRRRDPHGRAAYAFALITARRSRLAGRLLQFGGLVVIELFRPRISRPGAHPLPVALKSRTWLQRAEHHAETDLRADIEIGGAETIAHQIIDRGDRRFKRAYSLGEIAVAHHPLA